MALFSTHPVKLLDNDIFFCISFQNNSSFITIVMTLIKRCINGRFEVWLLMEFGDSSICGEDSINTEYPNSSIKFGGMPCEFFNTTKQIFGSLRSCKNNNVRALISFFTLTALCIHYEVIWVQFTCQCVSKTRIDLKDEAIKVLIFSLNLNSTYPKIPKQFTIINNKAWFISGAFHQYYSKVFTKVHVINSSIKMRKLMHRKMKVISLRSLR